MIVSTMFTFRSLCLVLMTDLYQTDIWHDKNINSGGIFVIACDCSITMAETFAQSEYSYWFTVEKCSHLNFNHDKSWRNFQQETSTNLRSQGDDGSG
jgi:hypothetical protein